MKRFVVEKDFVKGLGEEAYKRTLHSFDEKVVSNLLIKQYEKHLNRANLVKQDRGN